MTKLEGKVLGGELVSKLALERAPGGASLAGDLRITDMNFNRPTAGAAPTAPPAKDTLASLSLEFSGRASTPGALVSVAAGKGELKLGDVTMHAPTPLAVVATSDAVLSGQAGGSGEQLVTALRAQIDASAVAVGPRTIPIEIADGAAKLALVTIELDAGATKVETTVDLASLVVDSAWLAEPKAPDVVQADKPRGGALPSVGVVYTGPLANAWALEFAHHRRAAGARACHSQDGARCRPARAPAQRRYGTRAPRRGAAPCARVGPGQRRAGAASSGAGSCGARRAAAVGHECAAARSSGTPGHGGGARHSAEQRQRARRRRASGARPGSAIRITAGRSGSGSASG